MFNKLKVKIRNKLRIYLGIKDLRQDLIDYKKETRQDITNCENNINRHEKNINNHNNLISQFDDKVETIHNTVENVIHIGTDVRQTGYGSCKEHSWAVVCIEGKMNIVKFVDLDRSDAREVLHFLKQFEAGRHCIDAPCKEMFLEGLWKF